MNLKEIIKTDADLYGALIGTIFADGHISKIRNRYKNCCCEITHTEIHLDYLKFKKQLFEMIPDLIVTISPHNKKTQFKTYYLYRLMTRCNPYFTEIRNRVYDNQGVKHFPIDEIKKMNDLGLFLMYLDDGCLKVKYKEGTMILKEAKTEWALCSFSLNEIIDFENWLLEKYGIKMRHYKSNCVNLTDAGYILYTNTENTKKFMDVIDKFDGLVPSFNYKFLKHRLP